MVKFNAWPEPYDKEVIEAVNNVMISGKINYWTGDQIKQFEKEFAEFVGTKYAIAVANGTVALEAALFGLDIGPGDQVIVTPRTFIASASAIVSQGAEPVFAEIDHESQNITAETIEAVITERTKAIIAVHLAGWPCEMDAILALADKHNLKVIEDCAQAHGAKYRGYSVGSLGVVNAWSFCQDKIISTGGEGGMLTLNDDHLYRKIWSYKDHGKSHDLVYGPKPEKPGFRWLHTSFGTNLRMTEIQGAIGRVLLRRLPEWVERRRYLANLFNQAFQDLSVVRLTIPPEHIYHSYYKYYIFLRQEKLADGWSRDRIMQLLVEQGIPVYSGSCSEIYLEKAFNTLDAPINCDSEHRLPVAKELGELSLMFLVHPSLTDEQVMSIAAAAHKVLIEGSRH